MKNKIIELLKNKFNIALIVLQALAILSYFLQAIGLIFSILFFVCEGAFFIIWGIKYVSASKDKVFKEEMINQMPYSEEQKQALLKNNENSGKNNKFVGVSLILLGIVIICCFKFGKYYCRFTDCY